MLFGVKQLKKIVWNLLIKFKIHLHVCRSRPDTCLSGPVVMHPNHDKVHQRQDHQHMLRIVLNNMVKDKVFSSSQCLHLGVRWVIRRYTYIGNISFAKAQFQTDKVKLIKYSCINSVLLHPVLPPSCLHPSCPASHLACIYPVLHPSLSILPPFYPASLLPCLLPFLTSSCPNSDLSCLPPVLLSCLLSVLPPSCPASRYSRLCHHSDIKKIV